MQILDDFNNAEIKMKTDTAAAAPEFERILFSLNNKPAEEFSDEELLVFAKSNLYLFMASDLTDMKKAGKAVEAFELAFSRGEKDSKLYESYLLTLHLTYQYAKAKEVSMLLLNDSITKEAALKFLSLHTFSVEGLQSYADTLDYKRQLIDITDDPKEKQRLQKELESMQRPD